MHTPRGKMTDARPLIQCQREFNEEITRLAFGFPVAYVYNPLAYARDPYERYLRAYGAGTKRAVLMGMNPGPWGMVQTGIPFGEVGMVKGWLHITGTVSPPPALHPKRPVEGFACTRQERSGLRLWTFFQKRFKTPARFFREHFVINYCPLAFFAESGVNLTPDKLPTHDREKLLAVCDTFLARALFILRPRFAVGIGRFAEARIREALAIMRRQWEGGGSWDGSAARGRQAADWSPDLVVTAHILHPSPASPAANKGWEEQVTRQLIGQGVWSS